VEVHLQLEERPEGAVFLAVVNEVSDRRRAEDMLARYRLLSSEARDIILFARADDGAIVEANAAAEAAYGYTRDEILTLTIHDLHSDDAHEVARQLGIAAAEGVLFETIHFRRDGTPFPVEVSSKAASLADGQTVLLSVIRDVSERKRAEASIVESATRLKRALKATVAALGQTTELRDPYTAGHQRRVAALADAIATQLGWDDDRRETLHTAALLHDIGKVVVPADILVKPGQLTELEMLLIREHARAGAEAVADIEFAGPVAGVIRQHHERLDGSGYPAGLRDDEIFAEARILAVADVVEAMVSHRPYRPALPTEEAMREIAAGSGVLYDPEVCEACTRVIVDHRFTFNG
jgi:PAS domain S-box-containing protein/putative nucleotidyltransferase with HDIG domain